MPITLLVNGQPLEKVYSYNYLGLLLTSDLSCSTHIYTLFQSQTAIGMLYRKFCRYSDMETLTHLYVAFIHPNLECATAVWNPTFISHFNYKQPPLTSADLPLTDPSVSVDNILCSEDQVYELLTSIDTTTAKFNGHDNISAIMLMKKFKV